jgi:type I restriction enzyme, S subunit
MMEKKLPKGWVETKLDTVVFPKKGKKPQKLESEEFKNSVPYLDIYSLEKGIVRQYADAESSNLMDDSMIAIVWDGARSGWVSKGMHGAIGSTLAALKPIKVDINYIFYFLQSKFNEINTNPRGIGIPHVDPTLLWNLELPLPPLPTQHRIVAKLDSLFARIDQMKSSMERIPQLLKAFRQSVLTQAVTGKLTEEWREGKVLDEWDSKKLGDYIEKIQAGKNFTCPEYPVTEDTVGLVKISAVTWGKFNPNETKTVLDEAMIFPELFIKKGDFLISRANTIELVGASLIVDEIKYRIMLSDKIWRVNFSEGIDKRFVDYYLKSSIGRNEIESRATGNQMSMRNISQDSFRNIEIKFPPLEEQQEIVRRVESLFAKADRIEAQYQSLKAKIEQLPQALLAKAFRGELVEQLPEDGDARELLEEIKKLKTGVDKKIGKSIKYTANQQLKQVAEPAGKYGK